MKVAITGANGFLGTHLVNKCLSSGFQVIALVRKGANCSSLPIDNPQLSTFYINYSKNLTSQLEELRIDTGFIQYVIHNAGLTVSLDKNEYFQINTFLTEKVLSSIKESKILSDEGKFIYISSYAAHGPSGIGEPVSYYGESKKEAEKLVLKSDIPHLIFRPTAIYGGGDYAFLPLFKAAKRGLYPITSSKQKMSMIHGADLAAMVIEEMPAKTGVIFANDGHTYLHQDFIEILEGIFERKIFKVPVPAFLSKISLGLSDLWHSLIKKRPGLTLEKFKEISQDWDLHERALLHSNIKARYSLKEGFADAYQFYKSKRLL
ncbi:MAG: NAD-dependent epimerase/dehydratase family protein [Ekhidna sp.]